MMRAFATRAATTAKGGSNSFFGKSGEEQSFFSKENTDASFFGQSPVQPKLQIGQPNDAFEQEADAMADQVVDSPDAQPAATPVQKKCEACEGEEKVDKKEDESQADGDTVMKKSAMDEETPTETDETSEDSAPKTVQAKKESPTPAALPKSQWSAPVTSHKDLSGGGREITQKISFTQYLQKAPSSDSENKDGEEEKEAPIRKDQIQSTEEDQLSNKDNSVSSSLNYKPTVRRGGVTLDATDFGSTGSSADVTNVVISPSAGTLFNSGIYTVTGDLELKIKWDARSGVGHSGQIDIQNANDPDLKACNYQLAASDLTPDMGSDNGRPPRTKFWAEDLTIRHELYHAVEQRQKKYGPIRVKAIQDHLNKQKPTSAGEILTTHIPAAKRVGQRAFNNADKAIREDEAYGDGAPLYQARANAITAKGDSGGYGQVDVKVTVHPKGGGTHTVVSGDTLWDIAETVYGHGKYWRKIHKANPGLARDGGNLIFPGQVFTLPHINFDKEVGIGLAFGANLVLTSNELIAGGTSHVFQTLPNLLFDATTNCDGDITVEVFDVDANSILSTVWTLPANKTERNGNIQVDLEISSGAPAGP
ncbi:MAG: LysM peptidoglycan-binding domain-containing protein [Bacteroidota bacterium]